MHCVSIEDFCTNLTSPLIVHIASMSGYTTPQYAVIIDAGSTGSRVLAYKFHRLFNGGY